MKRIHLAKYLAIPLVLLALVSRHSFAEDSAMDVWMELFGYALLVTAALGRLWAAAFISGRKGSMLITEGPYSMTRNPLYFFSLLGFVGAGLAFESVTLAAAFGLLFFLTHWPTILREEKTLSQRFGAAFEDYRRRAPRFLPNPWRFRRMPATISISPAVFSRAFLESALVLAIFFAAEFVERVHTEHPQTALFVIP